MKLTADSAALRAEVQEMRETKRILSREAWRIIRTVSFWLERAFKGAEAVGYPIPVDTGRARASWGHWTVGSLRADNPKARAMDAVWKENPGQLEIVQGSNVEYMSELDAGKSPQAPAGFIDDLAEKAQDEIDRLLTELLRDVL